MKLWEIDTKIRDFWNKIMEQEGELTESDIETLDRLEVAKDEKVKAYGVVIREGLAEISNIKTEKERLDKILKTLQNKIDWLTNRLANFMTSNEMQEYKSIEVNITFRPSTSLYIEDETKLPKKWLKIESKPDKQAIKDFINAGGKVKGCEIRQKNNIQIK